MNFLGELISGNHEAKWVDLPGFVADFGVDVMVVDGCQQMFRRTVFGFGQVFYLAGKTDIGDGILACIREGNGLDFDLNNPAFTEFIDR